MDNKEKGFKGLFQGVADSVRTATKEIKIPEIKLPEIKRPKDLFPGKKENDMPVSGNDEIPAVSVQGALRIFYYLMAADGIISSEEETKFEEIGNELDPDFEKNAQVVLESCRAQVQKAIDSGEFYDTLQDSVEEAFNLEPDDAIAVIPSRTLIWDLLTVAYTDHRYDLYEEKIVKYVVRKLHLDKTILMEMLQSIQAISELDREAEQIQVLHQPFLITKALTDEIACRKNVIFSSVKDLIEL